MKRPSASVKARACPETTAAPERGLPSEPRTRPQSRSFCGASIAGSAAKAAGATAVPRPAMITCLRRGDNMAADHTPAQKPTGRASPMKLLYFNDYRLGVLKGDRVVDVTTVVQNVPHTGPGNLINGVIERWAELRGPIDKGAGTGTGLAARRVHSTPRPAPHAAPLTPPSLLPRPAAPPPRPPPPAQGRDWGGGAAPSPTCATGRPVP